MTRRNGLKTNKKNRPAWLFAVVGAGALAVAGLASAAGGFRHDGSKGSPPSGIGEVSGVDEGRGWVEEDLPLKPTERRVWEDETGPVTGPLVRRVRRVRSVRKWVERDWPQGFLSGKSIYLSPGHGWYWTGTRWTTQRGNNFGIVEDLSNAESVDQFLTEYLVRAGAHVVPLREIDLTTQMLICDDADLDQHPEDCTYEEQGAGGLFSDSTLAGYGRLVYPIASGVNVFDQGGNRLLATDTVETARFVWALNVPESNFYNVYVSYSSFSARASDAHYIVIHPGGETHFRVDQRHHGATWVFLGRFWFDGGLDAARGAVALANDSADAAGGANVSGDAVRIGGGMGIIDRGDGVSGHPRYEECCRYHAQFNGAPSSVYNSSASGDNTDDVSCRSRLAAWIHEPGEDAIYFSFHTNAGGGTGTSIYVYGDGAPGVCTTPSPSAGSVAMADAILAEVVGDIRAVWDAGWTNRGRRCAWFGELNPSYNNEMPAALIELMFHDLLEDVEDYREPAFRRIAARAIYKGIARYFAQRDGVTADLLPEPPRAVRVTHRDACSVEIAWLAPAADPAGGDPPQSYRVYVSSNGRAFDAGTDTAGATSYELHNLGPGAVYYFQVTAVNAGGESLPSRTAAVSVSGWPVSVPVLVIQGFGRLDSSQLLVRNESSSLGDVDRMILSRMNDGSYVLRHAPEILAYGSAFDYCEDEGVALGHVNLDNYHAVDLVVGRGATTGAAVRPEVRDALRAYVNNGGNLLITGSHLASELTAGSADDRAFLSEGLGSAIGTGTPGYQVAGGGILASAETFSLEADPGPPGGYDVEPSDVLVASGSDATEVAGYTGSGTGGAGIQRGQAGSGSTILLSFPLEGIGSWEKREAVMAEILGTFRVESNGGSTCSETDGGAPDDDGGAHEDGGVFECRSCPCDKGCSCRTVTHGGRDVPAAAWLVLLVFAALWAARRRAAGKRERLDYERGVG